MSVRERQALDYALLLNTAHDLSQSMLRSVQIADFLYWKSRLQVDHDATVWMKKLERAKDRFVECERFGHFHPNYHEALEAVQQIEHEGEQIESVKEFKRAEQQLDELLYDVSVLVAHSVSDSIKVPSNNPLPKGGGCGSGGSCNCG
jgi:cell fate (sporulation/competence/biofilm development) regulator YlbF (YheA/YmcA/DUF963 family)